MAQPPVVVVVEKETFFGSFRKFLLETNAIALAMAVVIGAAAGKLVSALVDGLIMPVIGMLLPGGNWREWRIPLAGDASIALGSILGATLDFVLVALVVFIIAKKIMNVEVKR